MKKIALLLCAAALMMVACEKEKPTPEPSPYTPRATYPPTADVIYDAVTDNEGHHYDAVRIGEQTWMASNLRTSHFPDGRKIPRGHYELSYSHPYFYTPSDFDVDAYGYLYNWAAVMNGEAASDANPSGVQGVCPDGWHVPSRAEWQELVDYCSGHDEYVCNAPSDRIAKALSADYGWHISGKSCVPGNDVSSNNYSGFSVLPAGVIEPPGIYYEEGGQHFGGNTNAFFWSSTTGLNNYQTYLISFTYNDPQVHIGAFSNEEGLSVRCVKD